MAIFGALAGAASLNEMAVAAWGDDVARQFCTSRANAISRPSRLVSRPGYRLMAQTEHFGDVLAAADVAVSRAGGTVWELAAAGTPSILVPYPHATADHQTLNAQHFERGGERRRPRRRDRQRAALVAELLADRQRLAAMRVAMLSMARVDAADRIAEGVIALARR